MPLAIFVSYYVPLYPRYERDFEFGFRDATTTYIYMNTNLKMQMLSQ